MPVELRKRPPPKEPAAPPPAAKRGSGSTLKKLADKAKAAVGAGPGESGEPAAAATGPEQPMTTNTAAPVIPETVPAVPESATAESNGNAGGTGKLTVGQALNLDGFGGTVQTHDGTDVTVSQLLEKSGAGIVLFTYPKASTPGCKNQACLFRDNYTPISGASLAVYGLSTDSPKANTTFATKENLPYPLLCDPGAALTAAIGMKKPGPGKSTTRGVVIIDKQGVLRVWEQGGPARTLEVVLQYVKNQGMTETGGSAAVAAPVPDDPVASEEAAKPADPHKMDEVPLVSTPSKAEQEAAETAAEVGESAARLDVGTPKPFVG